MIVRLNERAHPLSLELPEEPGNICCPRANRRAATTSGSSGVATRFTATRCAAAEPLPRRSQPPRRGRRGSRAEPTHAPLRRARRRLRKPRRSAGHGERTAQQGAEREVCVSRRRRPRLGGRALRAPRCRTLASLTANRSRRSSSAIACAAAPRSPRDPSRLRDDRGGQRARESCSRSRRRPHAPATRVWRGLRRSPDWKRPRSRRQSASRRRASSTRRGVGSRFASVRAARDRRGCAHGAQRPARPGQSRHRALPVPAATPGPLRPTPPEPAAGARAALQALRSHTVSRHHPST